MITRNDELPVFTLPGLEHRTIAGHAQGVKSIVNSGQTPIVLVAALGTAPVRVRTETGEPLPLPWAAPEEAARQVQAAAGPEAGAAVALSQAAPTAD